MNALLERLKPTLCYDVSGPMHKRATGAFVISSIAKGCVWAGMLIASATTTFAEHGAALVVGNSAYPDAQLATPSVDVALIAETLTKQGYQVTKLENLSGKDFQAAIQEFARTTPTGGTAIVYFSGYALKGLRDDLILLPIDARPQAPNRLGGFQPMGVRAILNTLETYGGSASHLIMVDGSYRHPLQGAQYPAGAIEITDLPANANVIFSAPIGKVLEPPDGGATPFAKKVADSVASDETSSLSSLIPRVMQRVGDLSAGGQPGDQWVSPEGLVFCWIPPGEFTIGSSESSAMREPDELPTKVEIPRGFWMSKYEYTRGNLFSTTGRRGLYLSTGQHKLIPLNKFREGDLRSFIDKLNESVPDGWVYALPTDAEWEYAARAGTTTEYSFGDNPADLAKFGNFADRTLRESLSFGEIAKNWKPDKPPFRGDRQTGMFSYAHKSWDDAQAETARVGLYRPNAWGLHDMHGNLAELTSTPYHSQRKPPEQFDSKLGWVCKGGSWLSTYQYCRSAFRGQFTFRSRENTTENFLGLRLVLKREEN